MLRSLLVLLAMALPVSAQCTQKMATLPAAPELFGFHLGMTRDEIKALVPQTVFPKADHFGVVKTTINPHFDPKIEQKKFEDVRSISLDLLDDRLTSLWIGYEDTYKIKTVDEFVTSISKSLQVTGNWSSWKSRGQQLRCSDFQLIVSTLAAGPSLRILDVAAEDTIAARRQEKEERDSLAEAAANGNNENESDGTSDKQSQTGDAQHIIGDKQSKTYFPNGCHPTREISDANKAVFKTVGEAEKAGFKLAKNCH